MTSCRKCRFFCGKCLKISQKLHRADRKCIKNKNLKIDRCVVFSPLCNLQLSISQNRPVQLVPCFVAVGAHHIWASLKGRWVGHYFRINNFYAHLILHHKEEFPKDSGRPLGWDNLTDKKPKWLLLRRRCVFCIFCYSSMIFTYLRMTNFELV